MKLDESTGYYHVETCHGRSAARGKVEGCYTSIRKANEAAKKIFDASCGPNDDPQIMNEGLDTEMFTGSLITGMGSGVVLICVSETMPEEMKKPELVAELKKLKVKNIESLSLKEMREKFGELKLPQRAARKRQMEKRVEEANDIAKKNKCKICGVPGGVKTQKETLLLFKLPDDEKEYYHIACAKNNNIILSSVEAKKFLGPTLFSKKERTPELPEAAGPNSSYGQARFFRIEDLETILEDAGKSLEEAQKRVPKAANGKTKGKRGLVDAFPVGKSGSAKKKKSSK